MNEIISVSDLVSHIKSVLDSDIDLSRVVVSGEISNYTHHSSGHLYFTLKDNKSQIRCVMFKSYAIRNTFEPKNGDKVILNGYVSVFEDSGSLQMYVNKLEHDGLGDLYKKYEELKKRLGNEGYFNEIGNVYRKIVVDKLLNADHLWTIYCDSTGYPYMVDDDIVVLYDYTNHARVEEQLGKYGYDISYGIEDKDSMQYEIAHLYRNGCRNIRFTDGKDNELIVSREEIGTYDQYIREDFVTNPGLQNALIKFFQEYRKPGDSTAKAAILRDKEAELKKAIRNADYMVPCTKEETDEEVSISHPYVDITDKVSHKEGEKILALPVFTDGLEMEKCYAGKHEDMLYTYMELLKTVKELGASGIVINPLGVSYYVPVDIMKQLITM